MKSLTAAMTTAIARTDGQAFRYLLEITPSGGATRYLCADAQTISGNTYEGELLSLGVLTESSGRTTDIQVSVLLNAANRAAVQLSADAKLLLWAVGTARADADLLLWGEIADPLRIADGKISFDIVARSMRQNQPVTRLVTATEFPGADPDAIGQIKPVIYGTVLGQPCLAVDAGSMTTLQTAAGASDTTLTVTDTAAFPTTGTLQLDIEQVTYTGKTATTFTGCARGANGTTASQHDVGGTVAEVQTYYDYLVADHPVQAIDAVYVDGVRQSGADFVFFPNSNGQAFVRFYTLPTVVRQVNLGVTDTIAVVDGISVVDGIVLNDGIAVNDTLALSDGITVTDDNAVTDGISIADAISVTDGINVTDNNAVTDGISVSDNISVASSQGAHGHSVAGIAGSVVANQANAAFPASTSYLAVTFPTPSGATVVSYDVTISSSHGWEILDGVYGSVLVSGSGSGSYSFSSSFGGIRVRGSSVWGGTMVFARQHYTVSEATNNATPGITSTKSGSASKTGTVTLTGGASKTGTVTKSGSVTKSGTVTLTGGASKTGTVSRTGGITKSGTVSRAGNVAKSGSATKTGTVVLTGNSVADTKIGGTVTADVRGYEDDASGTITGTPNALIERPDHIARHILLTYAGADASEVPAAAFDAFTGQKLAVSLTVNITVRDLLQRIAKECNATIAYSGARWLMRDRTTGTASLTLTDSDIVRQDSGASTLAESRSGLRGIVNRYIWRAGLSATRRRWAASGEINDTASQTSYGVRADHINLHDVHDQTQALTILNWQLTRAANPNRAVLTCSVLLGHYALEVGDLVDVSSSKTGVTASCEITAITRQTSGNRNGTLQLTMEEL